jgi:hypothetical protein
MTLEAIICLKNGRRLRLSLSHPGDAAASRAMLDRWVDEGDVISIATADGRLLDVRADDVVSLQVVERADQATHRRSVSNHALAAPPPPPMRRSQRRATDRAHER